MRFDVKKNLTLLLTVVFLSAATGASAQFGGGGEDAGPETKPKRASAVQKSITLFGLKIHAVKRMNLDQCLQAAMSQNPEVGIADYSIEAAREKKNEVNKLLYPIVDYEYQVGPVPKDVGDAVQSFFSGDISVLNKFKLGIGVPVHTFGKVKVGQALAESGIQAELQKKEQKKGDVALKVKQLYYGILLAQEVNKLLSSARDSLQKQIDKREGDDATDPAQVLKLKLFRGELDKRLEEGDKKEMLAREAMRIQLGLDPDIRFDPAGSLSPARARFLSYEQYRREAFSQRPEVKLLDIGVQAKENQVKLEKRLMAPNLAVGAFFEIGRAPGVRGVTTTDDFSDPFNFTRAGIGLQLKGQLDYHASTSKIRQAKSELYKIQAQRELAQDGMSLEIKEAFLDVRNARLDMQRSEEMGKISRQLLFLTQSNYDIGLAEPKDLVDSLTSFLQTRGQYFESVFNYNNALAKLDQKIGRLP